MSGRKNIKIYILSLTMCLSTLSFYTASAMEFKQIEINTPKEDKREPIEINKTNIKNYRKTIMNYLNNINENCCEEYGTEYIKKNFDENYKILKNQLEYLKYNKIDMEKFTLQLEKFKILKIDPNKRYIFPDEETENNLIEFINYIKNFLEEKKEELNEYLNNKNNKNQIEITKEIVEIYKNKIINYKKKLSDQNLDKEIKNKNLQTLFFLLNITSEDKFNFKNFILILSRLENNNSNLLNNSDYTLYYLKPETKKNLETFINEEKNFFILKNQDIFFITEEIILEYIKNMNESLIFFINEYMCFIQNKDLNMRKLNNLKNRVEKFFCFDNEEFNYKKFLNNLKELCYMNFINTNNNCKQNEIYIVTKSAAKNLKSNINKAKNIIKNIYSQIENISKIIKDMNLEKKFISTGLIKNSINSYLNQFLKYKIDIYKYTIDIFLKFYETNEFINENLKNILESQKNKLLNYICLNNEKKLDKKNFIENLKSFVKILLNDNNYSKIDFTIPEYYEKKLEEQFNENKNIIDNLSKEFQTKYENITKEIKNNKNIDNENQKEVTEEMINKLKETYEEETNQFTNSLDKNSNITKYMAKYKDNEELENYIEINKINLLNNLCLTHNKKLDKKKFIKLLKRFNIIDDLNYKISEKNEFELISFLINNEIKLNKSCFEKINKNKINIIPNDNFTKPNTPCRVLTKDSFNTTLNDISKLINNFKNATSEYLKNKQNYQNLCDIYNNLKENKFIKTGGPLNIKDFLKIFTIDYDETKEQFINNDPANLKIDCEENYGKEIKKRLDENNKILKSCFEKLEKHSNDLFEIDANENIKTLLSSLKDDYECFSNKIKQYINKYKKNCSLYKDNPDLLSRYYILTNSIFLTPDEKLDEKNLLEILNFYDSKIFDNKTLSISKEQKKELENTFKKYKNSASRLLNILYYICKKEDSKIFEIKCKIKEIDETKKLKNFLKEYNSLNNIENNNKKIFNKFEIIEKNVFIYKKGLNALCEEIYKLKKFNKELNDNDNKNIFDYIYDIEPLICLDENNKLDFEKFKNNLKCVGLMDIDPNIEYTLDEKLKIDLEQYLKTIKETIEENKKLDIKNKNIITKEMVNNFVNITANLEAKILAATQNYKNKNEHNEKDLLEQKKIWDKLKTFLYITEENKINYIKLKDKLRELGYLEIDINKPYCQFEDKNDENYLICKITELIKIYKEKKLLDYCKDLDKLENVNNNAPIPNFNISIIPSTKIDNMFNLYSLELYKTFSEKIDNFCSLKDNKYNKKNNRNDKKNNNVKNKEKLKNIIDNYIKIYKLTFLKDKEKLNENAIKEIDKIIKEDLKIDDLDIINGDFAKEYKLALEINTNRIEKIIDEKIKKLCEINTNDAKYIKDQIKKNKKNLEKEFKNYGENNENRINLNDENEEENKIILEDAAPILLNKNIENINKPINNIDELKDNFNELQNRFKNIIDSFKTFVDDYVNLKDNLVESELTNILDKDSISKFNSIYNNFLNENKTFTKKQNEKRIKKEQEEKRKEKEEKKQKNNKK